MTRKNHVESRMFLRPNGLRRCAAIALAQLCFTLALRAENVASVANLQGDELRARIAADAQSVEIWRRGMQSVVEFADSRPEIFPPQKLDSLRLLTRETKEEVWNAWKRLLDYTVALDSVRSRYSRCLLIPDRALREASFDVLYAAFLAEYRYSLEFIRRAENDPGFAVLLDDPVDEIGLPHGTYGAFKTSFLNVMRATEFAALNTTAVAMNRPIPPEVQKDRAAIWKMGAKEGQTLTAANALDLLRNAGQTAWLPLQTGVAIWMGDTKVWRPGLSLITQDQIAGAIKRMEPGDIMLERREWYMSNVGLPGFWPHATIFIGTPEDRRRFFDTPEVRDWVRAQGQADGDFEHLLAATYPAAHALCINPQEEGHIPRVIEAIGEGVSFTTMEHSAAADSIAVLRPRLTPKERAVAIFRAFKYSGRPYDYSFDFMTDSAVVCTELVWKSYQPCPDSRGVRFPMVNILGRLATPANDLVRQFDETYGTPEQQYDLVIFLDGQEKERKAVEAGLPEFRQSWRRPKWHVVTQPAEAAATPAVPRPAAWAAPIERPGLPNLHKVSDVLYRGAQPTAEGMRQLAGMGIKTVVNLRSFHSDKDELRDTGLGYDSIAMKAWHPEDEDVVKFLGIVSDTNRTPVFVHCEHGADRTGTLCAVYRIVEQGWTPREAAREMTEGGFGFHPIWADLVAYVEGFDAARFRRQTGAK